MSKDATRSIQTGLNTLGYDPGPLDGVYGSKTRTAAERWIAANGTTSHAPVAAKPSSGAMMYQGAARYPIREIVVHCSATRSDWMAEASLGRKVEEIRAWHKANGWADIGYHWIIDRDGKVMAGRPETKIGAHVSGHNSGTLGICLIGGHGSAETDAFADHFTTKQDVALRQLIDQIGARTGIRKVSGHNEYAAKACPGFNVTSWIKGN